ncbi:MULTISPECIES: type VI secretion system accessory protein TagJ [Pseudomonas]|uniref:Virulence protein SciE type n=2 Tax=Pseudomonadaceae TaxID=135621 RepID=A0A0D0JYU4_9PSED|nr:MULTISPECIES: type VI secretion system accessory protein TagJ [Pseudomonas]KIQ00941.1 virulence protein SciE type [Pseudomonas fulva]MCW2294845.1 type VI secretion system protein ImpE [Pseudomonas sp. BIGb0408]NYH75881.1 type VI secretion system protein ImpE [Pseudomonas flavescens]
MTAEEHLRNARLDEALKALQDQVRAQPAKAELRVFLFQLLAVMGQWSRAQNQLKVAGDLDAACLPMVQTYSTALNCEALRENVFAGRTSPVVLGQPAEWVAPLILALEQDAQGNADAAQSLRDQAFEAASAVPGQLDDAPFAWLADADPRLGPVLELIVNGRYVWLPMENIASLSLEAPSDLRDLVWLPAQVTLTNGGSTVALIPSRYPGSHTSTDGAVRMARKTEWQDNGLPLGQRLFAFDQGEQALFDVRTLSFEHGNAAAWPT